MAGSPKKPKDITGVPLEDEDLEKVSGGMASFNRFNTQSDCECAKCGLSKTIKVSNYNSAADPDS